MFTTDRGHVTTHLGEELARGDLALRVLLALQQRRALRSPRAQLRHCDVIVAAVHQVAGVV